MGFLDDVKQGANNLAGSISGTVDDTQARYRAESLLYDYGFLLFREQTGHASPTSQTDLQRVWEDLHRHLAANPNLVLNLKTGAVPPPVLRFSTRFGSVSYTHLTLPTIYSV